MHLGFIFFQKKKTEKHKNIGFVICFEQEKRKERISHSGHLEDDRQKSFSYFGISIKNFKVETVVSHRQSKEEYRMEM